MTLALLLFSFNFLIPGPVHVIKNNDSGSATIKRESDLHSQQEDSTVTRNKNSNDTSIFIPSDQFTWAGIHRYILDGSQPLRVSNIKPVTILSVEGTYFA